ITAFARAKYSPERAVRSRSRARSRSISALTRSRSMCSAAGRTADMRKHLLQVTVIDGHRGCGGRVRDRTAGRCGIRYGYPAPSGRIGRMRGLGDLGWLQFQQLCALVLAAEAGVDPAGWQGAADRERTLVSAEPLRFAGRTLPPPVLVRCAWLRGDADERRLRLGPLDGPAAPLTFVNAAPAELGELPGRHLVVGEQALLEAVDRHPAVRLALPSVLALRPPPAAEGSTLDLAAALELAGVFVPTLAYERALARLRRHHFLVLTGPPEMGKTAIARMLSLALMSDGWEAHECTRPEQLWERLEPGRPQVFVADDAFGSNEYRPDSAERWARDLDRILRATGERTWLVWTSRPAPLRAGLGRIHRERGGERFPQPAEVQVDASALGVDEKTLILFRHARAAGLSRTQCRRIRDHGQAIVSHAHFTPERIRRFVARNLDLPDLSAAIEHELSEPTEAMAASYAG